MGERRGQLLTERARILLDAWDTYGAELQFVENRASGTVHVIADPAIPDWARSQEPLTLPRLTGQDVMDFALGAVLAVCGVRVRCHRGGMWQGGSHVGSFRDELLCARCHGAFQSFGDRAAVIFECNPQPEDSWAACGQS